jgi:hypothetical protein
MPEPTNADYEGSEGTQRAERNVRSRKPLHRWMMERLGNEWCGNYGPPRDNRNLYIHDDGLYRVFSMNNDGFEVGIGYPNEWQVFMRWQAARMFAWWVFKMWVIDWFGLRTELWYMALHRSVGSEWKWRKYRHPNKVWKTTFDAWWEAEGKALRAAHNAHSDDPDQPPPIGSFPEGTP